ncbi:MAG: 3-hydroxyisobutyrate dehydrogenase [Pseudomonadota bacterium]
MKIAFLGLGTMGKPMAERLSAQHQVAGWDIAPDARAAFPGGVAETADALTDAEVVVTMLPEGQHVSEVYRTHVLPRAQPGTLLIDCSTIDVDTTRLLADEAAKQGLQMVDAPVSGGAEGAAAGSLSFMVGGEEAAYDCAQPILGAMGSKVAHFGAAGAGQAAKACHNMICGITALGVCEAFALADGLGLDAEKFYALCQGAAAQSWILENRCPVPGPAALAPASNGYAPGFAARLMAKDLRLGQMAANACGQGTPFGAEAARRFTEFAEAGGGDLDFSAIYRTIRNAD